MGKSDLIPEEDVNTNEIGATRRCRCTAVPRAETLECIPIEHVNINVRTVVCYNWFATNSNRSSVSGTVGRSRNRSRDVSRSRYKTSGVK
jgi:hypothetical protein